MKINLQYFALSTFGFLFCKFMPDCIQRDQLVRLCLVNPNLSDYKQ